MTLYVVELAPAVTGGVMLAVVAPVLHKYVPPPDAVQVGLASPTQAELNPLIAAVGTTGLSATVADAVAEQLPCEIVTV